MMELAFLTTFAAGVTVGVIVMFYLPFYHALVAWLQARENDRKEVHQAQLAAWRGQNQASVDQVLITQIIQRTQKGARFRHTESALRANRHDGFVYLMCMNNEYYKIGYAADVQSRFLSLRSSTPYELELVHVIATEHMARLELMLHQEYGSKRMSGEWFRLAPEDVAAICFVASPVTIERLNRQAF